MKQSQITFWCHDVIRSQAVREALKLVLELQNN